MLGSAIGRVLQTIPTLVLVSIGLFALLRVVPGDPAAGLAGPDATPETVAAIRHELQLDAPLPLQYGIWLKQVVSGDLGSSLVAKRPVSDLIAVALPASLQLLIAAMVPGLILGGLLGVSAAVHRGRLPDVLIGYVNAAIIGVPGFWMGLLAIMLFAVALGWLPPGGRVDPLQDPVLALRSLILPALVLGLGQAAVISRVTRASVLDVLNEAYVRTAHAKGLGGRRVLMRHALPNALIPIVTIVGVQVGHLIGGAVIIETVFAWPGMGRLAVNAIGSRDYPVIQAVVLIAVVCFITVNLITDLLYTYLDPRTSGSG